MSIYKLLTKPILYLALPFIISIPYGKPHLKSKTLTIMHLGTDTDEYDSIMDFIAELINEREDILPDYRINFENHYVQLVSRFFTISFSLKITFQCWSCFQETFSILLKDPFCIIHNMGYIFHNYYFHAYTMIT